MTISNGNQKTENSAGDFAGVQDSNGILSVNLNADDIVKPPLYTLTSTDALVYSENGKLDKGKERITRLIRKWLVFPICFLYGGALVTTMLVTQQFVYVKLQRENFPNITIQSSIPVCKANESDPSYQIQQDVQQKSAAWQSYITTALYVPAIFSGLILGSYTDRFGRKFLFFFPAIGGFLNMVIFVIGVYTDFALYWYIPGSIAEGLTGTTFGLLIAAFGYMADITEAGQERSMGIVIINLVFGISMTAFSVTTGFFIQNMGFFWPMLSAAILMGLTVILILMLPETYPKEKRVQTASTLDNLYNTYKLFCGKENAGRRWMYNILLLIFTLSIFTALGRVTVETLYQLNDPFCWDPKHLSWFAALSSGAQGVLGMSVVKPLQAIFTDEAIAVIGCISLIAGEILEGFAWNDAALYASAAIMSLGMLTLPMIRAIMSKLTPPDKQGAVFASIACVEAIATVGGVVVANAIYQSSIGFYKGFVFFVFAACNFVSLLLMWGFKIGASRSGHITGTEKHPVGTSIQ